MEALIKLLILQLIVKDFIDIAFIRQDSNLITIYFNVISLSIAIILFILDYCKLSITYLKVGLFGLCAINSEIPFQQKINFANVAYFAYTALILFNIYSRNLSTRLIVHFQLLYVTIRVSFTQNSYDLHTLLIMISLQPINHYIIHQMTSVKRSSFTQTLIQQEQKFKQTQFEQDQLLSSESKRDFIKYDLNESIILKAFNGEIETPQQEHKYIGINKDQMDQRIIIKKHPNNLPTTLVSDSNYNMEPLKLERNTSTKYSEIVSILNNLPFGILFVDSSLTVLDFNQKVTQLLGLTNPCDIIAFLDQAIQSGDFCEFRSSKKIRKPQKSPRKKTFQNQPSISPQKVFLEEHIPDAFSQYNNNASQFKGESDANIGKNLKSIFQNFKKIHQSQLTSLSRDNFQYIIRMDNMNQSGGKIKYKSLKLKIFQLEGFVQWESVVYLFFLENITKREEYRLLNHKYKFQQALLNSLCHELRTPINGTVSQLYALKDQLSQGLIESHLDPAIVSAKRLQFQLNDILDYAQIQFSSLILNKSCFKLQEVYQLLYDLFNFECVQKNINLIIENVSHISIYTDKERLIRIFINLLDNSVKFTNKGGTIKVITQTTPLYYKLSVEDNGQGISEEVTQKIEQQAELLFQDSLQYDSNKLGLGLRISQQLAKYLYKDQFFEIDSVYDKYTKVSFRVSNQIHNYSNEFEFDKHEVTQISDCDCSKILIVDDISCNHFALQVLLKKFKVKTDSAYNGNSAIDLVKQRFSQQCCKTYRLIFMDIEMPGKNGFQASKEINQLLKERNLNESCIITMYSAYSGDDDVLIASQCGMKERISKPTDIQKLEYLVNKYIL
ncbi:unnamed protein product [Paramecium octaurelia]|uniref:Uncharacterized protein n=1 Tax=Paramecium octaurelia TaxID=43137 RepID=A0A8S1Y889_PAROT|nr:unnamed protein product [Paramecium octaurelia]